MLRACGNAVLAALLAPPCAGCGAVLDRPLDGAACDECWRALRIQPADFSLSHIRRARAIGPYEGMLRELLHALKYEGRRSLARPLSRLIAEQGAPLLHGVDCCVPVPLHPRRHRERGFNQSADLSRALGVPVRELLRRVRATEPQVELPAERRRENVHAAFAVRTARWTSAGPARALHRPLVGLTIVLVDDVATTGATLEACAAALRAAGAAEVRALTAARVATARRG